MDKSFVYLCFVVKLHTVRVVVVYVCLYTYACVARTSGKKYYLTFILVGKMFKIYYPPLAPRSRTVSDKGLTMAGESWCVTIRSADLGNVRKQIKLDLNVGEIIFLALLSCLSKPPNAIVTPQQRRLYMYKSVPTTRCKWIINLNVFFVKYSYIFIYV